VQVSKVDRFKKQVDFKLARTEPIGGKAPQRPQRQDRRYGGFGAKKTGVGGEQRSGGR
jgi:hypothetical protein